MEIAADVSKNTLQRGLIKKNEPTETETKQGAVVKAW